MEAGKLIIKTELDSSDFEDDVENLDKKSKLTSVIDKIKNKFSSIFSKDTANKIGSLFSGLGTKLIGIIKKVISALGIIGVVIGVIVMAISYIIKKVDSILGTNSQLKADIQYIIWAIKNALEPATSKVAGNTSLIGGILTKIIGLIITIVKYAMALANLITGRNLFKNATIENFKKSMEKSNKESKGISKNMAKTTKEMQKQLAGFDEMNVLSKNVDASGGGGGGITPTETLKMPSFDVTDLTKFENKIKEIKDKVVDTWNFILNTDHNEAKKLIDQQGGNWKTLKLGAFDWLHGLTNVISGFANVWGGIFDIITGLFSDDDKKVQQGVQKLVNGVKKILEGLWHILISQPEMIWGIIKGIGLAIWDFIREKVVDKIKKKIREIIDQIKKDFKESFWKGILNIFIRIFNKVIDKINNKLTISIGKTLATILSALGVNVKAGKYSLFTIPKIPELAQGGIINMPGRGIPVGGAIAGERGTEGVIPLTDSQQMALLGEAIGKYINLSATIPVYVGSRQVAREMRKIELQDAFAGNR